MIMYRFVCSKCGTRWNQERLFERETCVSCGANAIYLGEKEENAMNYTQRTPEEEAAATEAYEKRREEERKEAEEHRTETVKLIEAIRMYLMADSVWQVKYFDQKEYIDRWPELHKLHHSDGRAIHFGDGQAVYRERKKKLHISGQWPMFDNQYITPSQVGEKSPSIEVSRDRGAAVIAKEIMRRFLPEYTRIWQKCKARVDATIAHENKTQTNYEKLCEVMGINPTTVTRHGTSDYANINVYNYFRGAGYGDISVSGDSVEIHLRSIDISIALEIGATLKAIHDRPMPGARK